MRPQFWPVTMLALAILSYGPRGSLAAATAIDFKNASYPNGACGPVTLSGGSEQHAANSADGPTISTELDEVHTGKLGTHDAAVVELRCGGPGGYASSSADVYLTDRGRLTFLGSVAESDSFAPELRVRFASPFLYVDVSEHPELAGANVKWKVTTYRLNGKKLVTVNVLEHIRKN
jgi:hypothetical protein